LFGSKERKGPSASAGGSTISTLRRRWKTSVSCPVRCHELTGDLEGLLSLDLDGPYRLYFRPAHDPPPSKPDGGLDWSKVTEVVIESVYDPHE